MILATLLLVFSPAVAGDKLASGAKQLSQVTGHAEETKSAKAGSSSLPDAPLPKAEGSRDSDAITPGITASVDPFMKTTVKPAARGSYETEPERKIWYGLVAAGHSAAVFDAYTTRRAVSGNYGVEGDPIMRPFAHSNAMYFATQVSPSILDYVGYRMVTSEHHWMRRVWWVPQVAGTSLSLGAGIHNYRLVP